MAFLAEHHDRPVLLRLDELHYVAGLLTIRRTSSGSGGDVLLIDADAVALEPIDAPGGDADEESG